MLIGIGFILMSLGVTMADSECLIVPMVLALGGAVLMLIGQRREEARRG